MRAFFDATAFFAGAMSSDGASRELLRLAALEHFAAITSELVFEEARRNLQRKCPSALPAFHLLRSAVPFEVVHPTADEVVAAARHVALKDAPIVAGARLAKASYLVSLDRRHLVGNEAAERHAGLRIVLPAEILRILREGA